MATRAELFGARVGKLPCVTLDTGRVSRGPELSPEVRSCDKDPGRPLMARGAGLTMLLPIVVEGRRSQCRYLIDSPALWARFMFQMAGRALPAWGLDISFH